MIVTYNLNFCFRLKHALGFIEKSNPILYVINQNELHLQCD